MSHLHRANSWVTEFGQGLLIAIVFIAIVVLWEFVIVVLSE